jgi:hypothetical protein
VGFRVHEEDEAEFKEDPAAVDGEVLPADSGEGDRVDVVGEEAGALAEDLLNTNTHGALGIREEFDEVGVGERVVSDVVAGGIGKVEKQSGNSSGGVRGVVVLGNLEVIEGDGHGGESKAHGRRGDHEHETAAEPGNDESSDGGIEQAPASVGKVDSGLRVVRGVAHHGVEQILIVREQGVAGHLGEKTEERSDDDTAAHTSGADHIHPALLGEIHLDVDGGSDLSQFGLGEGRVVVTLSVELDEDVVSLLISVVADEPSGGLGKQAEREEC